MLEVEKVVQLALQSWGSGTYHVDVDPNAPHEAGLLRIDSSKSKRDLGWVPKWDATTAIQKTVDWYRHAMSDPLGYTRGQICEYVARASGT